MAMNKLDEKIKKSFEKRRMSPTENSWENLSERLHHQEKKSSQKYWLMGIAVSFLVGVLLTSLVFQQKKEPSQTPSVVSRENKQKIDTPQNKEPTEKMLVPTQNKQAIAVSEASTKRKKRQSDKKQQITGQVISSQVMIPKGIQQKNNQIAEEITDSVRQKPMVLVTETSAKILNNIKQRDDSTQVTDAEINQLIREATLNIKAREIFDGQHNQVNAQALLENAEKAVNHSFHERVFEAVQKGLQQVKTAVANRNF